MMRCHEGMFGCTNRELLTLLWSMGVPGCPWRVPGASLVDPKGVPRGLLDPSGSGLISSMVSSRAFTVNHGTIARDASPMPRLCLAHASKPCLGICLGMPWEV